MPPKKKQQEIDLSTLPPWVSKNVVILCSGSTQRRQAIMNEFKAYPNKMLRFVDEAEIIEHAKTKQFYVDITTLTEKQKKELKPETPTELTEEVKAKSFSSLINQLNVANRVDRKNKQDALNQPPPDPKKVPAKKDAKKEEKEKEPEPVVEKQYNKLFDSLYVVEKYPQTIEDIKEMDKENEVINYVIIITPQLIYPEEEQDEQQQQEQQEQQQNESKQQSPRKKKQPKYPREQLTEQDSAKNTEISIFVSLIRNAKKVVPLESEFRNCLIKQIKLEINIDKQQEEIKNIPEFIFQHLCQLSLERANYEDWLKVKIKKQFIKSENQEVEEDAGSYSFNTPLDLLVEIASSIQNIIKHPKKYKEQTRQKQLESIQRLFDDQIPVIPSYKSLQPHQKPQQHQHFNQNYWPTPQRVFKKQRKDIFQKLMLPGIDRTLMPEIPDKSYQRRRYDESTYINFIKGQFGDFERIQTITEFEKLMEKVDPSKYCFNDRIYEQYHNKQSIIDTFTKIFLHDPEILSKYDEKTDSLYVAVFFKNPDSRQNIRKWVGDWKTTPNFDNWFNHIKINETNYKNNVFYNIDDTKLGRIVESTKETSPEDGSIVIQRVQQACDTKKVDIKIIREEEVFGIKRKKEQLEFWYTNFGHRVSVTKQGDKFQATITLLSGLVIVLNQKGHVYQKHGKQSIKTLPKGFTIVYNDHKSPKILHPNGGLTAASESFSNPIGLGVQYPNALKQIPTLKRTNTTHSVTKREDQTVIIEERQIKWIKFYDGTTYEILNNNLKIDKKGFAQGSLNNNNVRYSYQDVDINGVSGEGEQYSFDVIFKDGSKLTINKQGVLCLNHQSDNEYYKCDFENQQLTYFGKSNKSFTIQSIQNYQVQEKQHKVRQDFTEPRLFLIKNDNTAAEFFSEKQLKKYFSDKQTDENTTINRTHQAKHELIQVTSKIYPRPNVEPISPNYPFDIDVIPIPKSHNTQSPNIISTLRIFVKLRPLTNQDRESFNETLKEQALWRSEKIKADNEFGYLSKDPNSLEKQMAEIKRMISRRKQAVTQYPYNQLRDKLLSELVEIVVLDQKQFMKNQSGGYSLKKSLKRLNSEKFDKDSLQNQEIPDIKKSRTGSFVPYTPCTNYFQTPGGQAALSQMPAFVFEPKESVPSVQVENQTQRMFSSKTVSRVPQSAPVFPDTSIQNASQSPFFQPNSLQKTDNNISRVSQKEIVIKPSVFTQQDIEQEKKAFEEEKKAYQKRALKRKEVDVYGKQRTDKPVVPTLLRTQPVSEVNQKYILTESITEQKVKISSMKSRMMMNSSNLSELRKEGPHQAIIKSIDMSNTLEQIYEKRTQMVHANIKDSLSRDILILPAEANFGVVKQNSFYQLKIDVKNEDVMCQRIAIKRAKTNMVKAFLNEMGPIPLGISRKVIVQLKTSSQMKGKFTDQFEIVSKHQIYKIPVTAQIISEEAFYSMSLKQPKQSLLKIGVSELKIQSNVRGLKSMNISQLPKI